MNWACDRGEDGNVALMGELPNGQGVLALGFAESPQGAQTLAMASLAERWSSIRERFVSGWKDWAQDLKLAVKEPLLSREGQVSAMVLTMHEDRTYPGTVVASLSIPWGFSGDTPRGYRLV